jgi:hypothetical protein
MINIFSSKALSLIITGVTLLASAGGAVKLSSEVEAYKPNVPQVKRTVEVLENEDSPKRVSPTVSVSNVVSQNPIPSKPKLVVTPTPTPSPKLTNDSDKVWESHKEEMEKEWESAKREDSDDEDSHDVDDEKDSDTTTEKKSIEKVEVEERD